VRPESYSSPRYTTCSEKCASERPGMPFGRDIAHPSPIGQNLTYSLGDVAVARFSRSLPPRPASQYSGPYDLLYVTELRPCSFLFSHFCVSYWHLRTFSSFPRPLFFYLRTGSSPPNPFAFPPCLYDFPTLARDKMSYFFFPNRGFLPFFLSVCCFSSILVERPGFVVKEPITFAGAWNQQK